MLKFRMTSALFLVCLSLTACATAYTGLYFIESRSDASMSNKKKEATAVRLLFTKTLGPIGFSFTHDRYQNHDEILPSIIATVPASGLIQPYDSLLGKKNRNKLRIAVSFNEPYSISIRDSRTKHESAVVKMIRSRLDSALTKLDPALKWRYHHDKLQLD